MYEINPYPTIFLRQFVSVGFPLLFGLPFGVWLSTGRVGEIHPIHRTPHRPDSSLHHSRPIAPIRHDRPGGLGKPQRFETLKTNGRPLKIDGWFRCIPYWNGHLFRGHVSFQGCKPGRKQKLRLFKDTFKLFTQKTWIMWKKDAHYSKCVWRSLASWCFQPHSKNVCQNGFIFPNFRGEHSKKIVENTTK